MLYAIAVWRYGVSERTGVAPRRLETDCMLIWYDERPRSILKDDRCEIFLHPLVKKTFSINAQVFSIKPIRLISKIL